MACDGSKCKAILRYKIQRYVERKRHRQTETERDIDRNRHGQKETSQVRGKTLLQNMLGIPLHSNPNDTTLAGSARRVSELHSQHTVLFVAVFIRGCLSKTNLFMHTYTYTYYARSSKT